MSDVEEDYGWGVDSDYYGDGRPEELEGDFFSDSVHYKSTSQKRKEKIMATQQITISAVTREPKNFGDETIWGVKVGSSWMDLHVDEKPSKGQSPIVETWTVDGKNGKTYVHARPVAGQSTQPATPAQPGNGNRATYAHSFGEYVTVARKAHAFALELEPGEAAARARTALVSTFVIAFGKGEFGLDAPKLGDEWDDVTPSGPAKYAKAQGHVHLEKTIWAYCERENLTADDALAMLKEVSGKADVLELSEKDAIAARLKVEKIIDGKTDYKVLFGTEARKIAQAEGWNFDPDLKLITEEAKKALNDKKRAILLKAGMKSPAITATQQEWKDAWEQLTDEIPF